MAYHLGPSLKIEKSCEVCAEKYSVFPCRSESAKFCSRSCLAKSKKGTKKSDIWKKKVSKENSYRWIKDRTQIKKYWSERNNPEYKQWRNEVWKRDAFKCRISNGDCCGRIEAHHILSWSEYPELRYQPNNGITLCHAHHPRKRAEEKRLAPVFQELVSVSNLHLGKIYYL